VSRRYPLSQYCPGGCRRALQPNHPTDDSKGIAASVLDGLLLAFGDAVIGVNPVTDTVGEYVRMTRLLDDIRMHLDIPTQTCVLGHVTAARSASLSVAGRHSAGRASPRRSTS
jgi:ethanolamine ammonia-lyase large subunit